MKHNGGKRERGKRRNFKQVFEKGEEMVASLYEKGGKIKRKKGQKIKTSSLRFDGNNFGLVLVFTNFLDEIPTRMKSYLVSENGIPVELRSQEKFLYYNENGARQRQRLTITVRAGEIVAHNHTIEVPVDVKIEGRQQKAWTSDCKISFRKDQLI